VRREVATREVDWMRVDKIFPRRRWELQQDEHGFQNTSPTQLPKLAKTTQPVKCYSS
jgi:hypothetical protein